MAKKLSFNQWVSINPGVFTHAWIVERGRLTRVSVEAKSVALGNPQDQGHAAWDAYSKAVGA